MSKPALRACPYVSLWLTQMPPEHLPMGNLSWNLYTFQASHLGQILRAKWGGIHEINFLLYKLVHSTQFLRHYFCTCRSPISIMSPIGMHSTQAKSLTSHSSPNTSSNCSHSQTPSLFRIFDTLEWHSRTLVWPFSKNLCCRKKLCSKVWTGEKQLSEHTRRANRSLGEDHSKVWTGKLCNDFQWRPSPHFQRQGGPRHAAISSGPAQQKCARDNPATELPVISTAQDWRAPEALARTEYTRYETTVTLTTPPNSNRPFCQIRSSWMPPIQAAIRRLNPHFASAPLKNAPIHTPFSTATPTTK
jgi:hypothetical protein